MAVVGVVDLAERVRAAQLPRVSERRRIRQAARVSLRMLAEALGKSEMTMSRWERGVVSPSIEDAIAYRQLLDELEAAAS